MQEIAVTKINPWLRLILISFFGILFFSVTSSTVWSAQTPKSAKISKKNAHAPDRLLVRFKAGAPAQSINDALGKAKGNSGKQKGKAIKGLKKDRSFKSMEGLKLVHLPPGRNLQDAISQLKKNPNVLYVEPDYQLTLNATPNDTSYSSLWALHNSGQTIWGQAGTADVDINAPEAWNVTTGSTSVVIAVLDSGVNHSHPDLLDNMWVNPGETASNGIDDDGNGYIDDIYGIDAYNSDSNPMDDNKHGSHVAGTISAVGNNGVGVTGVSQSTKIIGCKIGASDGSIYVSAAVICMDYVYDLKVNRSVNIVATNNSWGGGSYSVAMYQAIEKHMNAGILFVAAAGNDGTNNDASPHYPSNYYLPNVIAVAATDNQDNLASFSEYGRRSVHIGAPGVGIYSTTLSSNYEFLQGTSMATPQVSGLIALLAAEDGSRDWKTLKNLVIAGGKDIASLDSTTVSGRRIRAWDSDGTGSMTCSNQTVSSVLHPVASSTTIALGGSIGLAMLNIKCATPNGGLTVTGTGPASVNDIYLLDDGQGFDKIANDGIYSAYWTAPATAGSYTLTFPDSQTASVTVGSSLTPYRKASTTTYSWRDLSGLTPNALSSGAYYSVGTSFPIEFAGYSSGYSTLYFTAKGTLSFQAAMSTDGTNIEIPNAGFNSLIAPFWDDLVASSGNVRIGATSTEYVMEWQVPHTDNAGSVHFQVVFTKDSSDIIFNYKDVTFGTASLDAGASASVGVQVTATDGVMYSQDSAALSANTALLWQLDSGAPTASAGSDQNVAGAASVTLSGSGTDPDSGSLTYSWSQISGTSVSITNANAASASFTAPNTTETLQFILTVTDDAGRKAQDAISVNVTESSTTTDVISLSSTVYNASEGDGTATITVKRAGEGNGQITVNYATSDATATAGSDYTATSGTLTWTDGQTGNKTFTVSITDDSSKENPERLNITLSNVSSGGTLYQPSAELYIADNEATVRYADAYLSVSEGDGTATISVERVGSTSGAISVDYATISGGTATASTDYTTTTGTLNWASGVGGTKSFTVTIADDSTFESTEYINLQLSNAVSTSIDSANHALYINDNDSSVRVQSTDYSVNESDGTATVSVMRIGGSSGAISVDYATVAGGTATATSDYTSTSGTLSWADGNSDTKTFDVTIVNDSDVESLETINVQLSNPTSTTIADADSTIYIYDDEAIFKFSAPEYSVTEGTASVSISVTRVGGTAGAVSVDYTTTNSTAVSGSDFTAASGTLNWADGVGGSKSFSVTITDDSDVESFEKLTIDLSNAVGATISTSSAPVFIYDNEAFFKFSAPEFSVTEGTASVSITVNRIGGSSGAVSVDYATANSTATAGSDYTAASGTLNWSDGETGSKSFSISITDDSTSEPAEKLAVNLSNAVGANIDTSSANVYIYDNDTFLRFQNIYHEVSEGVGTVSISVTRLGSYSGAVSVDYAAVDGNTSVGSDYTAASGTLSWSDGESGSKSFNLTITDDSTVETFEYLTIDLSNASGASILQSSIPIIIYDNESIFRYTNSYVYATEGDATMTVYVKRYGDTSGAATVDYATAAGGTATSGSDYTAASGTLSWSAGEGGSKSFTVSITDDADIERYETINVQLSNASGGSILSSDMLTYLYDNESAIRYTYSYMYGYEGDVTIAVTVKRYGNTTNAASVDYSTSAAGTAVAGSDFTTASGTLSWSAGVGGSQTFNVTITDDGTKESYETIGLSLSNAVNSTILSADSVIYLYDND